MHTNFDILPNEIGDWREINVYVHVSNPDYVRVPTNAWKLLFVDAQGNTIFRNVHGILQSWIQREPCLVNICQQIILIVMAMRRHENNGNEKQQNAESDEHSTILRTNTLDMHMDVGENNKTTFMV